MSEDKGNRSKDLVLAPNEFAFILDETKGNVDSFVGPHKTSLANTDQPVVFNSRTKRFEPVTLEGAKQTEIIAPEGYYVVLKNPAKDNKHPSAGVRASGGDLVIGKKLNIAGPTAFALYPGQMAKVLQGHNIRSNQYLLVRVYDEAAAKESWSSAVMKPSEGGESPKVANPPNLTMGKMLIIKGTDVSFYIPPTGIEVVPDEHDNLVREAVTLERLDYCLLKDENGNKRYLQGPVVVFPEPTEVFVEKTIDNNGVTESTRRFSAIELNENSGIYIKVISDYKDGDKEFKVGEELFITGKDQMIYFPRDEHAIVKYGDREIHYGVAIPAGEARYILNRNDGNISLVSGPTVYLPDPREEVVIRRILDAKTVQLLYPGNQSALEHNAKLLGVDVDTYMGSAGTEAVAAAMPAAMAFNADALVMESAKLSVSDSARVRRLTSPVAKGFAGDGFNRKGQYTEPRSITLKTKYEGAVSFDIWTGYAVQLVRKSGERKVVVGPRSVTLQYDESPQILTLSRGKPKTTDDLLRTAFLLVTANKISDIIEVETRDFCRLKLKLSYRVNFEGNPEKWFDVENYVKFLCDHMRSKIRNVGMRHGVEEFYGNAVTILRDVILGAAEEGKPRAGTAFKENGMRIYDVEVLGVELEDKDIQKMLVMAQREVINQTLAVATARRNLIFTKETEYIKQEAAAVKAETTQQDLLLQETELKRRLTLDLAVLEANAKKETERLADLLAQQIAANEVDAKRLEQRRAQVALENEITDKLQSQRLAMLEAEVSALVEKAKAVSPDLVAALTSFGERELIEKTAKAMAPLAILGGNSVQEVLGKLLEGTALGKHLAPVALSTNGKTEQVRA